MSMTTSASNWLAWPRPNPHALTRLFCFPYAGGGAYVYQPWLSSIPQSIEFCAINLPGRGTRIGEAPYQDSASLVSAIAAEIQPYLDKRFAFFGHSMGAIVSYELARQLRAQGRPLPVRLLVSACHGPHLPDPHPIHELPQAEFLKELSALGGIPQEVLDSKELMELILPGILADFTLVETYAYTEQPPLNCPISAFGGLDDGLVNLEQLQAWQEHTSAGFDLKMFPGNHFFINSSQQPLLQTILEKLS